MKTTSKAFGDGYNEALSRSGANTNPFKKGTDEYNGFKYFADCCGCDDAVTESIKKMANDALLNTPCNEHLNYQQMILEQYGEQ